MTELRPARHEDAAAVAEVIRAADEAVGAPADTGTDDVRNYWREFDPAESALVAEHEGKLVAYVDVVSSSRDVHIDAYIDPRWRESDLPLELLRAAEGLALAQRAGDVPLRATVVGADSAAARLLEQEGYAHARSFFRMGIKLAEKPPKPVWPAGATPRAYRPGPDDAVMHATLTEAFADGWEPRARSPEEFARVHASSPDLAAEASFLAYSGDEPAGAILSKRKFGRGWIESVGVRRPWRGAGLGLALLQAAFGSFYDVGQRAIGLDVDAASPTGAPRLYTRAGMQIEITYDLYEKRVHS